VEGRDGGFEILTHAVSQEFQGAPDLDILPALAGKPVQPGRVWCAANTPIKASLKPLTTAWTDATSILFELLDPGGAVVAHQSVTLRTPAAELQATARSDGFHTFRLTAAKTPATNENPDYTLSVTYTATQTLNQTEIDQNSAAAATPNATQVGQWSPVIDLANVPIHTHLLPTGKILFWGRRDPAGQTDFDSLNQHETRAFLWDPSNLHNPARPTSNQPTDSQGKEINLFCSGHTFLEDGRLLVTGGHLFDSQGLNSSTFYDPANDKWSPGPVMNNGRWYPTAVTLPDGKAFVSSGSFPTGPLQPPVNQNAINPVPQILEKGAWQNLTPFPKTFPLFPRFHVAPSGALFMSGSNATTFLFENFEATPGVWVPAGQRSVENADYAPSVMFDVGKVVYIGGGSTTNVVEVIDLNVPNPAWTVASPMKFHRRQHNATILPDGSVLVTGGSEGTAFNDLGKQAVHTPELWNPKTGVWTEMAPEAIDRCYHSTAVLLPDGRVFSGGGGEYAPSNGVSNPPGDTHANAQLFSPPYLFKGARPKITKAPPRVVHGEKFSVETPDANAISEVTLLRLGSVTHSFDQNQRINFLAFQAGANQLGVTAPSKGNVCPPGHYMLFILNNQGVPSEAVIIQIAATDAVINVASAVSPFRILPADVRTPAEEDATLDKQEREAPIEVGVTPTCPYGISACWGGAYEALSRLHGVRRVKRAPNERDSTAYVYLEKDGLPDLDLWPREFAKIANGTHYLRGVEVTVTGVLDIRQLGSLVMRGSDSRPPLFLEAIEPADKIQWDAVTATTKPLEPAERSAYSDLLERLKTAGGSLTGTVTGPLQKSGSEYVLEVRRFSIS
jgi:galactose oxidase